MGSGRAICSTAMMTPPAVAPPTAAHRTASAAGTARHRNWPSRSFGDRRSAAGAWERLDCHSAPYGLHDWKPIYPATQPMAGRARRSAISPGDGGPFLVVLRAHALRSRRRIVRARLAAVAPILVIARCVLRPPRGVAAGRFLTHTHPTVTPGARVGRRGNDRSPRQTSSCEADDCEHPCHVPAVHKVPRAPSGSCCQSMIISVVSINPPAIVGPTDLQTTGIGGMTCSLVTIMRPRR